MTAYVVETTAAGAPSGPGAIAVLEVVGPDALDAVGRAFGPGLVLRDRPLHTTIADGEGELDDVVIAFRPPEESMTGWPHVEIQCHGSPAIVKRVRRALVAVGVKPAPQTFLLRTAVRNRRMTRLEEEAWLAAMSALTDRAANELWEQRKKLPAIAGKIGDTRDRKLLNKLRCTTRYGQALVRPVRVAVTGKPNVGKSTLINALAGRQRVLVDARPGTTRDAVEVPFDVEGIPFVLVDTAGLRDPGNSLEQEGIEIALKAIRRADLVLHLKDVQDETPLRLARTYVEVWTKADLHPDPAMRWPGFWISAITGEGLQGLQATLLASTLARTPVKVDGALLFTARQMKRARELFHGTNEEWQERWERWVWGRAR